MKISLNQLLLRLRSGAADHARQATILVHQYSRVFGHVISSKLVLIAILALATVLRLDQIDQPLVSNHSWRQASTAMMAKNFYQQNRNIFYPKIDWAGPGDTYNGREFQVGTYIASLIYRFTGISVLVGRLVSVAFGIFSITCLYYLVKNVWDEWYALVACLVMAISPGAVFYDRQFLPDPVVVSLSVACSWRLIGYLAHASYRNLMWFALSFALMGLAKITSLIILVPIAYSAFMFASSDGITTREEKIICLRNLAIVVAIGIAVVATYYSWAAFLSNHYPPYHFAGQGKWIWSNGVLAELLSQKWFLKTNLLGLRHDFLGPFLAYFCFIAIVLNTLDMRSSRRDGMHGNKLYRAYFILWLAGMFLYVLIGSKHLSTDANNLYLVMPSLAALSAYGLIRLLKLFAVTCVASSLLFKSLPPILRSKRRVSLVRFYNLILGIPMLYIFLVFSKGLLVTTASRPMLSRTNVYKYQDYALGLALRDLSAKNDLVIAAATIAADPISIYYSRRVGWTFPDYGSPIIKWHGSLDSYSDADLIYELHRLVSKGGKLLGISASQLHRLKHKDSDFLRVLTKKSFAVFNCTEYSVFSLVAPSASGDHVCVYPKIPREISKHNTSRGFGKPADLQGQ
ncbi:ArnT family glycosyltransferase [Synechococcus sp. CBW1107]|uniref:ArnT family glycosyltransferase n=1 Tax=Synechococcus sp. CBW1107 TaxID=2789857 RepID=UPI002AD210A5|nr:glycosyltransferase family 39 protein [Synechococcus sp. CBW1107]CAK6686887.1 hypothetical protein ICNINCKA_00091 [Synechococcus sp. CBW1107]